MTAPVAPAEVTEPVVPEDIQPMQKEAESHGIE